MQCHQESHGARAPQSGDRTDQISEVLAPQLMLKGEGTLGVTMAQIAGITFEFFMLASPLV